MEKTIFMSIKENTQILEAKLEKKNQYLMFYNKNTTITFFKLK